MNKEEYWIKCGFKESGELICVRSISNAKPEDGFFYLDHGVHKEVIEPRVLRLSKEVLTKMTNII